MIPIPFKEANVVYKSIDPDVGDLPARRELQPNGRDLVMTVWEPSDEERKAIARGANVVVGLVVSIEQPFPPMQVGTKK